MADIATTTNAKRPASVSPTRRGGENMKQDHTTSSSVRAASSFGHPVGAHTTVKRTHKLKGDKLIFLNQITGDTVTSTNPCPKQNCVCTICICGHHHCPHSWHSTHNKLEKTEYQEHYIEPLPGYRRNLIRHTDIPSFQDQLPADHFLTTHAVSYVPVNLDLSERKIRGRPYGGPVSVTPFDGTSTHRVMFTGMQPNEKRASCKPKAASCDDGVFKGTSLSHSDLKNWYDLGTDFRVPRTEKFGSVLRSQPFTSTTTHRTAFVPPPKDYAPSSPCGPINTVPNSVDPFQHQSEYDWQYTEKELRLCPIPHLQPKYPSQLTGHVHYLKAKGSRDTDPSAYRPATVRLASHLKSLSSLNASTSTSS